MYAAASLQFLSRQCKNNQYPTCHNGLESLDIEILCYCKYHKSKNSRIAFFQASILQTIIQFPEIETAISLNRKGAVDG
jgi:hypothetical protein